MQLWFELAMAIYCSSKLQKQWDNVWKLHCTFQQIMGMPLVSLRPSNQKETLAK
jgi:hypothetical protein